MSFPTHFHAFYAISTEKMLTFAALLKIHLIYIWDFYKTDWPNMTALRSIKR